MLRDNMINAVGFDKYQKISTARIIFTDALTLL